jgi:uncharacterized membrane protein YhiD involved in acid resistance
VIPAVEPSLGTLAFGDLLLRLGAALGIGLLLGTERERRRTNDAPASAGIRTFALVTLGGAVARIAGGDLLLATGLAFVGGASLRHMPSAIKRTRD